jgi:hypothetical protein
MDKYDTLELDIFFMCLNYHMHHRLLVTQIFAPHDGMNTSNTGMMTMAVTARA